MRFETSRTGKVFSILIVCEDDQEEFILAPHLVVIAENVDHYLRSLSVFGISEEWFVDEKGVRHYLQGGTNAP